MSLQDPDHLAELLGQTGDQIERIVPGLASQQNEESHLSRYRWAARRVQGARVLDVASGTGYGFDILMRGGARSVICVDRHERAVTFGRDRFGAPSIRADALALPFRAAVFDAVVSFETIEHLSDPKRFLEECRRVLAPGGELLLSTPNPEFSLGENPFHLNELTRREVLDLVDATGFHLKGEWGQLFLPGLPGAPTLIRHALEAYGRRHARKPRQPTPNQIPTKSGRLSSVVMRPMRRIPGMSPILMILTLTRD